MPILDAAHVADMSGIEDPFAQVRKLLIGTERKAVVEGYVDCNARFMRHLIRLREQVAGVIP
jgi:hypothetical protein